MTLQVGCGGTLVAGERLGAGGQGEVFAVTSPAGHVFKQYFPRELAKDSGLERRLLSMVSAPPGGLREHDGHFNMTWPVDVVYEDGQFAGFIMPVIDMANTVGIHRITNPSDRRRVEQGKPGAWMAGFTWRYLVRTAVNLVQVTHKMHGAGTVIGDFNDANVRVGRDARVTLLDCDSMQIRDAATGAMYLCRVGRPEFTAPELLHEDWSTTPREPSSDIFALAIHLYGLLLEGEHPFRGVWDWEGEKPAVTELAARGIWAYLEGGPLIPRPAAIGLELLPRDIRRLFSTAFEHGSYSPVHRPGAHEWYQALRQLEANLRTCSADRSHVYPRFHGMDCPWCEHARRTPPPSVHQMPSPPPPLPPPAPPPSGIAKAAGTAAHSQQARPHQSATSAGARAVRPLSDPLRGRMGVRLRDMVPTVPAEELPRMTPLQPIGAAPGSPVPTRSWQEHWAGHSQLLRLNAIDDHSAVYFDADVDPRHATWIPGLISHGWEYAKATYSNAFGPDPRLYSVHHAGRYPGGRIGSYRDPDYACRNVIDLGGDSCRETDEHCRDAPVREIARLVEMENHGVHGSPAGHIWAPSGWTDIFTYDMYRALDRSEDAQRCYRMFTAERVSGYPRAWWFRDWFYPLWRECGAGAVLARFFSLLARYLPQTEDHRYARDLTWGEYIHFTSGAARADLRDQAARAFGRHPGWDDELARARSEFPDVTY